MSVIEFLILAIVITIGMICATVVALAQIGSKTEQFDEEEEK